MEQGVCGGVYTVEQVAEILQVGRDRVYMLLRTGRLRSIKIGQRRSAAGVPARHQEGGARGVLVSARGASLVSIMSDGGVPIEAIADLCGHSSPAVTGQVYRHQLRPVISRGARVADSVFGTGESA